MSRSNAKLKLKKSTLRNLTAAEALLVEGGTPQAPGLGPTPEPVDGLLGLSTIYFLK